MKIRLFNQKKTVVDRVSEENSGKRFRDDTLDSQRFDDLRCLLSG